jgi:hypothetical protein
MSEFDPQPRPYNPLEVQAESLDPVMHKAALELLEEAELRVPITDAPYARRMRVVTEAGDFEFQAIPWASERTPVEHKPLICIRRNQHGELGDQMDANYFILEGMSVGPTMRTPEDIGYIGPGYNLRYRPVKIEHQQISFEYQLASEAEREALHAAGWARIVNGHPGFMVPSLEPQFTQPVVHFDIYGIDQVPARLF